MSTALTDIVAIKYRLYMYVVRSCSGWGVGLAFKTSRFNFLPFHFPLTTLGKLFTHVLLSPSSIIWYRPKSIDALQLRR